MSKKLTITGIVAVAIVLGFVFLGGEKTPNTQVQGGNKKIDAELAGVSPDIPSPYFSYGSSKHWAQRSDSLVSATTTVCAIQSPAATSTLEFASLNLSTGSTTGMQVTIAKASTPYATTTVLAQGIAGANLTTGNSYFAVYGATSSITSHTFTPNQYLVVGMQGGGNNYTSNPGGATYSPVGTCQAKWLQIAN